MKNRLLIGVALLFVVLASCKKKDAEEPQPPGGGEPQNAASLISWSPGFPGAQTDITVVFDASRGNGGLKAYGGDVYMYAGVITDKSTGASDWKYVKSASFNSPDAASKMTSLGGGKYSIKFSAQSFFGVPASEQIKYIAMVFRNGDGTLSGRNKDGSDIYLPLIQAGQLAVRFSAPEFEPGFVPQVSEGVKLLGAALDLKALASKSASLSLTLNGEKIASANGTNIGASITLTKPGLNKISVLASDGSSSAESSFQITVNGNVAVEALPAGVKDGVTLLNGGRSAIFNIYAPQKQYVYLLGDFNNWTADASAFMKKTPDGNRWWIRLDGLEPNTEYAYQYWVDGTLKVADPYTEKVLDPQYDSFISASVYPNLKTYPSGKTSGVVSVMNTGEQSFSWTANSFKRPEAKDLVIYELHMRDFLAAHDYRTLEDSLNYLARLGINAIELMPVNEFEGNSSWGYNPSFLFAPDKYYGPKNVLKGLIDRCHARGIAVILDLVLNHAFGQSPMVQLYFDMAASKPSSNSPWFNVNATHPYNVGYDFNHESAATRTYSKSLMEFWMKEYRVDGFRFDLSKGFTQKNSGTDVNAWTAYDASRVAIWKDYNAFIRGIDPGFYVILEHFAADQEEKELADDGMLLWNNLNGSFNEASMGYLQNSDLSRLFYDRHGFNKASSLVSYMESHDEERIMFKNLKYGNGAGAYSVKSLSTALKRQQMTAAFLLSAPGPKMLWQFGELGYDVSIDEGGRTGEKPIRWEYYKNADRKALFDTYAKLIHWKRNNEVFASQNVSYNLSGAVKYILLRGASNNLLVVGNFDVVNQRVSLTIPPGIWYDNFGAGSEILPEAYHAVYAPGEFHVFSTTRLND